MEGLRDGDRLGLFETEGLTLEERLGENEAPDSTKLATFITYTTLFTEEPSELSVKMEVTRRY